MFPLLHRSQSFRPEKSSSRTLCISALKVTPLNYSKTLTSPHFQTLFPGKQGTEVSLKLNSNPSNGIFDLPKEPQACRSRPHQRLSLSPSDRGRQIKRSLVTDSKPTQLTAKPGLQLPFKCLPQDVQSPFDLLSIRYFSSVRHAIGLRSVQGGHGTIINQC